MKAAHYGTNPGHFETSIIHFPTSEGVSEVSERASERSGKRKGSEQSGASERVSGASKRTNGRASGPVPQSVFLAVLAHSGMLERRKAGELDYRLSGTPKYGDAASAGLPRHPAPFTGRKLT